MEVGEISKNKAYYAVQSHSKSPMSIPINRNPVYDLLLVIPSYILSRTASKLLQIIVHIWTLCVFWAPFGRLKDNVRCSSGAYWKTRLSISVYWFFSLSVNTSEALRMSFEIGVFEGVGQFWPNFAHIDRPVNAL